MTLPDERYRSVIWAEKFLKSLAYDVKGYPRVPKHVRYEARGILRHFPTVGAMQLVSDRAPEVFQEKMEPLHRLLLQHENENANNKE